MAERAGHAVAPQRIPDSPAAPGDNLTDAEQKEAVYWARKKAVMAVRAEKIAAQAVLKAINKRLTAARADFKRDTDIDLAELDRIILLSELERGERSKPVQDFNWMAQLEGLAPGEQTSLLNAFEAQEKIPSIPRDKLDWEMEGRNFYNRNLECKPPPECPPANITDFTKGWHDMEERTIWAMASSKVVDRDPDKRVAGPVPLSAEEVCGRCGDDGSRLEDGLMVCPDCDAEYEPVEESIH